MKKNKIKEENEQIALDDWKRALIGMDETLKLAQVNIRQLERVVNNIRARVGEV